MTVVHLDEGWGAGARSEELSLDRVVCDRFELVERSPFSSLSSYYKFESPQSQGFQSVRLQSDIDEERPVPPL